MSSEADMNKFYETIYDEDLNDYIDGNYTGKDIPIDIIWLDRENHNYSTTKLKTDIYNSVKNPIIAGLNYD